MTFWGMFDSEFSELLQRPYEVREQPCKVNKVTFSAKNLINIATESKKSPEFDGEFKKNNDLRKILGGKDLALRSLLRADEKCACFKCQSSLHDHNKIITYNNQRIHCGNAKGATCCNKRICQLCYHEHLKIKHPIDEKGKCACSKCQCSQHDHDKIITYKNQRIYCGNPKKVINSCCNKKICQLCYHDHLKRHSISL